MKPGAKSRAAIFGPRLDNCHEPAAPALIASSIRSASTPDFCASASASQTPSSAPAIAT